MEKRSLIFASRDPVQRGRRRRATRFQGLVCLAVVGLAFLALFVTFRLGSQVGGKVPVPGPITTNTYAYPGPTPPASTISETVHPGGPITPGPFTSAAPPGPITSGRGSQTEMSYPTMVFLPNPGRHNQNQDTVTKSGMP
jgi:hypothetical protein